MLVGKAEPMYTGLKNPGLTDLFTNQACQSLSLSATQQDARQQNTHTNAQEAGGLAWLSDQGMSL